MTEKGIKFRVRLVIQNVREYEKRYVNKPNEIELGEDVEVRAGCKMSQTYFNTLEEAVEFFDKLSPLVREQAEKQPGRDRIER